MSTYYGCLTRHRKCQSLTSIRVNSRFSGGVCIAHRFLVVSVLLIVFWWCLHCSLFSGGVCIAHCLFSGGVCIAHRFLVLSVLLIVFCGVCISHRFLVVSVMLIVFWWCLYYSSFSGGVCIAHRFLVVSVCLRPVSFVPNVASVSGLCILDCPFGFL